MRNLAVFASGTGSLFEAMLAREVPVKLFVADRQCRAIAIAKAKGIPDVLLERRSFRLKSGEFDRAGFTLQLIGILRSHDIGLVAMAGFMTILSPEMFAPDAYAGKILNSHPSLLPSFIGDHAVRDALAYGVRITGTTIHTATAELDAGPILAQEAVQVMPGDTVESLHERIKKVERVLYPQVLLALLN